MKLLTSESAYLDHTRCGFKDCPEPPTLQRPTDSGFIVFYCRPHYKLASLIFDKDSVLKLVRARS